MARKASDLWSRNGMFSVRFRVPKRYRNLEKKEFVVEALGTDSEADALVLAAAVKSRVMTDWALRAGGTVAETETARWQRLKDAARSNGHRLMTAPEVATAPIEEIGGRLDELRKNPSPDRVDALLDIGTNAGCSGKGELPPIALAHSDGKRLHQTCRRLPISAVEKSNSARYPPASTITPPKMKNGIATSVKELSPGNAGKHDVEAVHRGTAFGGVPSTRSLKGTGIIQSYFHL